MTLTDSQIDEAAERLGLDARHDSVRIAYEWVDAQKTNKRASFDRTPWKHLIENWGGFYVSPHDVDIATYLHPSTWGRYGCSNISTRLIWPHPRRLEGIESAGQHRQYRDLNYKHFYTTAEP